VVQEEGANKEAYYRLRVIRARLYLEWEVCCANGRYRGQRTALSVKGEGERDKENENRNTNWAIPTRARLRERRDQDQTDRNGL
jgi:hypothetical protein